MKDRHVKRHSHNRVELTGMIFGNLTVLEDTGKRKSRRPIWLCQCICGTKVEILSKYLLCGDTKSCGCITIGNAHNRTGYKSISGSYFHSIKSNAKIRGIPFEVTPELLFNQLEKQNYKCCISGVDIKCVLNFRDNYLQQTASLDRIDNSIGYVEGNIQWVHKTINIMRNKLSVEEFVSWCKIITTHQERLLSIQG